jgi:aryl-alcohol dehydrogenase-like predicted oxidoreductase
MLKQTLGKSKLEVSALGMGCWAIGGPWDWLNRGRNQSPLAGEIQMMKSPLTDAQVKESQTVVGR